jgi:aryl-alcohol dehydrogenase
MTPHIISQDNPNLLTQIIVVDVNESRLKLAEAFGATHYINPAKEGARTRVMEITDQKGLDAGEDCCGVLSVINTMIESIGSGGTVVTIGNPQSVSSNTPRYSWCKNLLCDPPRQRPLKIGESPRLCSFRYLVDLFQFIPRLASLYQQGKSPIDCLQKTYEAENINEAIADMKNVSVVKPVLLWA